jgi:hypothetical protein
MSCILESRIACFLCGWKCNDITDTPNHVVTDRGTKVVVRITGVKSVDGSPKTYKKSEGGFTRGTPVITEVVKEAEKGPTRGNFDAICKRSGVRVTGETRVQRGGQPKRFNNHDSATNDADDYWET